MAARLGLVAADDQPFDPGRFELKGAADHRHQPVPDPEVQLAGQLFILDHVIAANLVVGIHDEFRLAANVAHEARILAAVGFVKIDQAAAQFGLDHTGNRNDRRPILRHRRTCQYFEGIERGLAIAERVKAGDSQRRIEQQPVAAIAVALGIGSAIGPADPAIMIEHEADAGELLRDPALLGIAGIDGDPEEAGGLVVEQGRAASARRQARRPRAHRRRCRKTASAPPARRPRRRSKPTRR